MSFGITGRHQGGILKS